MSRVFLAIDFGQIQARIIEMDSKDPVYGKMLWERYDVHSEWTNRIVEVYPQWVPEKISIFKTDKVLFKQYRDKTKNQWTFPLFFGAQLTKVSHELGIPEDVLKPLVKQWWTIFSGVHDYHQRLYKFFDEHGYVESLTGRRFRAPLSRNAQLNYPIQGTEPDLVLDAMNRLSELEDDQFQADLEVHDDLTFSADGEDIDDVLPIIIEEMIRPTFDFINVPLVVEVSVGKNWCDLEKIGEYSSDDWLDLPKRSNLYY
jgi:DNA polymerase I